KPGATTLPCASTTRFADPLSLPISTILPSFTATSPRNPGMPEPSTIRPLRINRSYAIGLFPLGRPPLAGKSSATRPARKPAADGSLADQMQHQLARMGGSAVLEQINALPRAEHRLASLHRNAELCLGQCRLDMRRHVIGSLILMPVAGILRRQTLEEGFEVGADIWIGILLYQQRGGGVPAPDGQQTG